LKTPEKILALLPDEVNRVIEMAWEDRTPFDAIEVQFGLAEQAVIALMRRALKAAFVAALARAGARPQHQTHRFESGRRRAFQV